MSNWTKLRRILGLAQAALNPNRPRRGTGAVSSSIPDLELVEVYRLTEFKLVPMLDELKDDFGITRKDVAEIHGWSPRYFRKMLNMKDGKSLTLRDCHRLISWSEQELKKLRRKSA